MTPARTRVTLQSSVPRVAAATAVAVGTAALVGWAFGLPVLTSIVPGLSSMKANTATAFQANQRWEREVGGGRILRSRPCQRRVQARALP